MHRQFTFITTTRLHARPFSCLMELGATCQLLGDAFCTVKGNDDVRSRRAKQSDFNEGKHHHYSITHHLGNESLSHHSSP